MWSLRPGVLGGLAVLEIVVLGWAAPAAAVEVAFESASAVSDHQRAIERSRDLLQEALALYPGATVAVGYEGVIVWMAGFGYSDVRKEIPVTTNTRFRIAQVSEALTAAAAVRLGQEGRLDLDAPVGRYVPAFPDKGVVVTSRQLAGHLAGVRPVSRIERQKERPCSTPQDALPAFVNDPLARPPGTAFLPSSHGYVLLSAVIASASGQDFLACVEERILRPAGMSATVLESPAGRHSSLSRFYERAFLGMLRLAPPVDLSCAFGAAGFLSTARDLARFGMALLGGELVSPEYLSLLFSTQKTGSGASTGNGLGWRISADSRGPRMSQSGRTVGGRSAIVLVPERRLVVVILANIDGDHLDDHANRIATFFLEPE